MTLAEYILSYKGTTKCQDVGCPANADNFPMMETLLTIGENYRDDLDNSYMWLVQLKTKKSMT